MAKRGLMVLLRELPCFLVSTSNDGFHNFDPWQCFCTIANVRGVRTATRAETPIQTRPLPKGQGFCKAHVMDGRRPSGYGPRKVGARVEIPEAFHQFAVDPDMQGTPLDPAGSHQMDPAKE